MRSLAAIVLVLATGMASAAPAPMRRPKPPDEVVLDARTKDRAELVASLVHSRYFLYRFAQADGVREYRFTVFGNTDPGGPTLKELEWLEKHFSVIQEDECVRLRFDGPLPILRVATDELVRQLADSKYWERCLANHPHGGALKFLLRLWKHSKLQADPVRVIRVPRPAR